jgi:hypothetical protein
MTRKDIGWVELGNENRNDHLWFNEEGEVVRDDMGRPIPPPADHLRKMRQRQQRG